MSTECTICCSPYTKTIRKMVECNNCHFQSCLKCNQYYILNTNTEVKCMNCNVGWSMNFLYEVFSKKFCVDYRHHRREILWNKELYHIPVISEFLDIENQKLKNLQQQKRLKLELEKNTEQYKNLKGQRGKTIMERRKEIKTERQVIETTLFQLRQESYHIYTRLYNIQQDFFGGRVSVVKNTNNRPCITEACRGFVNSKGECPICNVVVCVDCNVVKQNDDHQCNQDDIETFKELSKNTKPCPKCNVRIHKISGCDQMWCVRCNTAFSWRTGNIETGRIHNPHYFDWLFNERQQQQPPQIQEIDVCNEETLPGTNNFRLFIYHLSMYDGITNEQRDNLKNLYQRLQHIISVDLRKYEISEGEVRKVVFYKLLTHVKENKNVSTDFEKFIMKRDLYGELSTILNNYKRSQIHLFRALFSLNVNLNDFNELYEKNKTIYYEAINNFNNFYKKNYKIRL